jgi:methionine-rich copper-binding protein CopC
MRLRRVAVPAAVALMLAITPGIAMAHADLVTSSPGRDAVLSSPPDEVALIFDGELRPDGTGLTVTDSDGAVVSDGALDLTVAGRNEVRGAVAIGRPGTYTVAWTAVSADGHRESGTFAFVVGGDARSPDTAARRPDEPLMPALGLILVAIGIGLRMARRTSV